MKTRLDKALEIYTKNPEVKIILSGGKKQQGISEAQKMKEYLKEKGLIEKSLILEERSQDTLQNIKYSKEIIEKNQFKNVALVTSDYHLKRALMIGKFLGLNLTGFIAISPEKKKINTFKEFFKIIFDYIRIKLR
jgi:uncharacterized SAM-binding protein YcdF (DUF218 family)